VCVWLRRTLRDFYVCAHAAPLSSLLAARSRLPLARLQVGRLKKMQLRATVALILEKKINAACHKH
jgi:hypothetical protein